MPAHRRTLARLISLVAACAAACGARAAPEPAPPLDAAARDRQTADSHFATAKELHEQGDLAGALRSYQRAWRWDPSDPAPLEEIVPLAVSLGRVDEAVRYALIAAERGRSDPDMLRRLALYVTEQQQWERAARLYLMWLDAAPEEEGAVSRALVHLEIGRLEYLSDNVKEASDAFAHAQRALLDDPQSPTAQRLRAALGGSLGTTWETFGRCHLAAGEFELARGAFDQMLASPDTERKGRYWAARLALKQDRPLDAYEFLWQYFDGPGDPLGALPYQTLHDALLRLNDSGRAETDIQRLRSARPESCYPTLALAGAYAASGREARAETLFEGLVREGVAAPGSDEIDDDAFIRAGRWLIDRCADADQPNRLVALARQLARRWDSLAPFEASLKRALADEALARHVAARIEADSDPSDSATDALAAARLALWTGEEKLAGEAFRSAIDVSGDKADRRATTWAVDLLLDEHYARAAADLRWAIDRGVFDAPGADPAPAWFYLGTALALGGEHDKALKAAQRAAELTPDSAEFAARPAWILHTAERTDKAIAGYKEVIERFDDDHDPATRAVLKDARMALSYLELDKGDAPASAEWLEQVLDEHPDDIGAKNDLGYLWADRGEHLHRAKRMIEEAVEAAPDNAAYLDSLGWVRFRLGDLDGALDAIQEAVAIETAGGDEADAEVLDHLGDVLHALARPDDAADAWRRAAQQFEKADDERAAKSREKIESLVQPAESDARPAG